MKSPLSILSPRWSGFLVRMAAGAGEGRGISLGGSGAGAGAGAFIDLLRLWPDKNGLADVTDARLFRSLMASDQLKPSPALCQ